MSILNIPEKDKDEMLESMEILDKMIPILEIGDPDFCTSMIYRMSKIVKNYGPRRGVDLPDQFVPFMSVDFAERRPIYVAERKLLLKESDIKDVIFNGPATVILWKDGTRTVVKCQDEDKDLYSPEAGIAIAIMKKAFGNKSNFNNVFHRLIKKAHKEEV